jgi:hypothetical protein
MSIRTSHTYPPTSKSKALSRLRKRMLARFLPQAVDAEKDLEAQILAIHFPTKHGLIGGKQTPQVAGSVLLDVV